MLVEKIGHLEGAAAVCLPGRMRSFSSPPPPSPQRHYFLSACCHPGGCTAVGFLLDFHSAWLSRFLWCRSSRHNLVALQLNVSDASVQSEQCLLGEMLAGMGS